ncbi:MAG: DUF1153 domain-containing protein [Alphaproteobacteria bacterium]|nr:DUF1153 domain-containing protein [Alphaproteobacteria bacterium]
MDRHFENGRGGEEANKADASVIVDLRRTPSGETDAARSGAAEQTRGLPTPFTRRWTPRGKAAVVDAVEDGSLEPDEACRRYDLTMEEIELWRRRYRASGLAGLMVTRVSGARRRDRSDKATA